MSIGIVVLCNIRLSSLATQEQYIEIQLADAVLEEIPNKTAPPTTTTAITSHKAFNQTEAPEMGSPVPLEPLQAVTEEQALPNEAAAAAVDFMSRLQQLADKRKQNQQRLQEQAAHKKPTAHTANDSRSSISYALANRQAYTLPPPTYTCMEGGKVVVDIKVDANGYVTKAAFNAKHSQTRNGCLVDNAIAYALQSKFSPQAQSTQQGSITYHFQGK